MKFVYPEGATPLDEGEKHALIPPHLTTQADLNQWEQNNILLAERWAFKQKEILTPAFIKKLHQKMFDKTWKWAGQFRRSEKNIGIEWSLVPIEIKHLCDDVLYQVAYHSFSLTEIAVRFHHRLVWIHPFANGNGRHARLMADLFMVYYKQDRLTWGRKQQQGANLEQATSIRQQYIQALRLADQHDYEALIAFAQS